MENKGNSDNHSITGRPKEVLMKAKRPYTGFKKRFSQINALTVGIMKKGDMSMTLAIPLPLKGD